VLQGHSVEAVMHFAALALVPESTADPEAYYRVNVGGTESVLDAIRTAGVCEILFSSTTATYGFDAEMPLRESSPQSSETPYEISMLAAEWMIKDCARAYGLSYTLLRYFNAAGADPDGDFGEDRCHEGHLIPIILQVAVGSKQSANSPDLWKRLSSPRWKFCARLRPLRGLGPNASACGRVP
jgi:UDP-glucose 4-epimerase